MTEKSKTCFKKDGSPLTVYFSEYAALEGASHVNYEYNFDVSPYKCSRCGQWHLSPKSRQTPSRMCRFCNKELYDTKEAAETRAAIIMEEQGIILRVYHCEHENGWHLTKNPQGW